MSNAFVYVGIPAALLVALKLSGVIGWSWWWVLSPLWGSAAIAGSPSSCQA
jgi:hypothetical protein